MKKICSDCNKELLLHEDFYTESRSKDGYKKRCKQCEILRRIRVKLLKMNDEERGNFIKIKYWENIHTIDKLALIFRCADSIIIDYLKAVGIYLKKFKPCGNCGKLISVTDFSTGQLNWNGWCKKCVNYYNSVYYKEHEEKLKEYSKEYYYANYDESIKYRREYHHNNKEKIVLQHKQYYRENIKERTKYNKQYYKENADIIKENIQQWVNDNRALANSYKSKYRAKKLNATPSWANLNEIKKFYEEAQRLTKETGVQYVVDHIIPLQGKLVSGFHIETNLQVITNTENNQKLNSFKPIIKSELKVKK